MRNKNSIAAERETKSTRCNEAEQHWKNIVYGKKQGNTKDECTKEYLIKINAINNKEIETENRKPKTENSKIKL